MMKLLVAAALVGVVKGQASQCSAGYLEQINTLCCTDDNGRDICHGGEPTRCNGNCATMFLVRALAPAAERARAHTHTQRERERERERERNKRI